MQKEREPAQVQQEKTIGQPWDGTQAVIERLLKSFSVYYDVTRFEENGEALAARCDYFEHSQKYVMSKRAELWSADSEEFLYLFQVPHLTMETFARCRDFALEDGKGRMHIGPGHMYSFITPVFVCGSCDEEARRALRKCRYYKSFRLSFYGWMDYRTVLVDLGTGRVEGNKSSHDVIKTIKKVLKL